jgi:hypothetical protein
LKRLHLNGKHRLLSEPILRMSKIKNIYEQLGFTTNRNSNTTLTNLTTIPKNETKTESPNTQVSGKFNNEQADLLFLPNDNGYKYALVVVDLATSICDAQPIKEKTAKAVLTGMKIIFKRGIVKEPKVLEVDSGAEFKGEFKDYYEKRFFVRPKETGRHRQQSVVESKNAIIGKLLNQRMTAQEINVGEISREWIEFLPKVIQVINANLTRVPNEIDGTLPLRTTNYTKNLLTIGTKVRTQLDNPLNYLNNERLHGKFRAGDIRWTKQEKPITKVYLRPNHMLLILSGIVSNSNGR